MQRLALILSLDLRSLAIMRMALALLVVADTLDRASEIVAFQTDRGVLAVQSLWQLPYSNSPIPSKLFCIHAWSGELWWQVTLSFVTLLVAVALFAGVKTRIATVLCWCLVLSVQMRTPLTSFGGDTLLRMMLFWAIFLPWGDVWSWDSRGREEPQELRVAALATAAYLLQIGYQYFSSGMFKTSLHWTGDGSAVFFALSASQYESSLGQALAAFLSQHPQLGATLTFVTLAWERGLPLLLFCPIFCNFCRGLTVTTVWLFHAGLLLTMSLGLFPYIGLACVLACIPSIWWDRWAKSSSQEPSKVVILRNRSGWLALLVITWTLVYGLADLPQFKVELPRSLVRLGGSLGFNQSWMLFAPEPPIRHGYYIAVGQTLDGRKFQLLGQIRPLSWDRPALVPPSVGGMRWRMALYRFCTRREYRNYRSLLCRYLAAKWESERPQETALRKVELYYVSGRTQLSGGTDFHPELLREYWL